MVAVRDPEYYGREYVRNERSTYDIADEHGTYANKIRREILRCGYFLRDKSEAQVVALRHGRQTHPTRGLSRPIEVRRKISQSLKKEEKDATHQDQGS
jgi:hypothetical protein